jgi:hypothetical protein
MRSSRGHDGQQGLRVRAVGAPTPESVAARLREVIPALALPLSDEQAVALAEPDPWTPEDLP